MNSNNHNRKQQKDDDDDDEKKKKVFEFSRASLGTIRRWLDFFLLFQGRESHVRLELPVVFLDILGHKLRVLQELA